MHRSGNKAAGFTNHLSNKNMIAFFYHRFGRRADVLRKRNDNTGRCGHINDGIAAVDSLSVLTFSGMHTARKQMSSKHGSGSPFHIDSRMFGGFSNTFA